MCMFTNSLVLSLSSFKTVPAVRSVKWVNGRWRPEFDSRPGQYSLCHSSRSPSLIQCTNGTRTASISLHGVVLTYRSNFTFERYLEVCYSQWILWPGTGYVTPVTPSRCRTGGQDVLLRAFKKGRRSDAEFSLRNVSVQSRDSLVGIATRLRARQSGFLEFDSRRCLGIFLFTTASRMVLGPIQPPIQWVPGALSLGVEQPRREANHSPPSSAEVKEWVALYFHSPIRLNGVALILKKAQGQLYLHPSVSVHYVLLVRLVQRTADLCIAFLTSASEWDAPCYWRWHDTSGVLELKQNLYETRTKTYHKKRSET
jgi:hypothetical protein